MPFSREALLKADGTPPRPTDGETRLPAGCPAKLRTAHGVYDTGSEAEGEETTTLEGGAIAVKGDIGERL